MISWKNDKLIAARNKGHIKNFGANALDANGIKNMFSGRGDIEKAFVYAMTDLQKAIGGLNEKQKDKIFGRVIVIALLSFVCVLGFFISA